MAHYEDPMIRVACDLLRGGPVADELRMLSTGEVLKLAITVHPCSICKGSGTRPAQATPGPYYATSAACRSCAGAGCEYRFEVLKSDAGEPAGWPRLDLPGGG